MGNLIKSVLWIVIGAFGGIFAGLPLGQILGMFVGNVFDMVGFTSSNANGIVISGLIGLLCGAILGAGFFLLAKTVLSTKDQPVWEILLSTVIGLAIGIVSAREIPGLVDFMKFAGLGQAVGVTVGAIVGCISGILITINVLKIRVIVTEEEKSSDQQYAQFLKNKAKES